MTYPVNEPEMPAAVAADVDGIGSAMSAANAAAAGPTCGLLTPAASTGILTVAGGVEGLVVLEAVANVVKDLARI